MREGERGREDREGERQNKVIDKRMSNKDRITVSLTFSFFHHDKAIQNSEEDTDELKTKYQYVA